MPTTAAIERAYKLAREQYARIGVDTEKVLKAIRKVPVSLHCWQGDDVAGFENPDAELSGGIQATGNYPGKARTPQELRSDAEKALSLIPGSHRFNLHAIYLETKKGRKVERNEIGPEHFKGWIDWAKSAGVGLDFNPTLLLPPEGGQRLHAGPQGQGHPQVLDRALPVLPRDRSRDGPGPGLAHGDQCLDSRRHEGHAGQPPRSPRAADRRLDEVFRKPLNPRHNLDAVEGKLFGIGCESYTVGMHEYYLGYAVRNQKLLCLDAGHYHPTENVSDKISSVLCFVPEILLHVSRGVRWDSDHVVILNDDLLAIAQELVRGDYPRPHPHRPGLF